MNRAQEFLARACKELGVRLIIDEFIVLESGFRVNADAHIIGIGPPQGVLIFSSRSLSDDARKQLISLGYGISIFKEPLPSEDLDISSYAEMLSEWNGERLENSHDVESDTST